MPQSDSMIATASATNGAAATALCDVLLLVTRETSDEHAQLQRRVASLAAAHVSTCGTPLRAETIGDLLSPCAPRRFVAVPLALGRNDSLVDDLGGLLRWASARWPETTFLRSQPIGSPRNVVGWAARCAQAALAQGPAGTTDEVGLLVVGLGGSSAENAEVYTVARLLGEHRDEELVEAAFMHNARPRLAAGINRLRRLGARRIIVLPLTLLDGPVYRTVRRQIEAVQDQDLVVAPPLLSTGAVAAIVKHRLRDALDRWSNSGDDGLALAHNHSLSGDPLRWADDILPPRYQGGRAVSSKSMGSAPLVYDAEGRVAWDRVWSSFCNLALAGGPPHRGTLLEPPTRDEVLAAPDAARRAAEEIARGMAITTRLPVVTGAAPGWVGLTCADEEMAVWMLRAIVVENVCVRREGVTLYLPAGPAYRVEKEIKNVITAVAKTFHYWTEHRAAR